MSGHVVTFGQFEVLQSQRPPIALRLYRPSAAIIRTTLAMSRIGMGSGLGLAFGLASGNVAFWLTVGTAVGWGVGRLMAAGDGA